MNRSLVKHKNAICLAALAAGLVVSCPAFAGAGVSLPGSVDPGRSLDNVAPRAPVKPDGDVQAPPQRAVPLVPEGVENLTFILQDVAVDGMTAYAPSDITPFYARHIGQKISVATLFEIMAAIQQKYLDDGYALTKVVIPNQDIQAGKVRFAVIEGHVSEVHVEGDLSQAPVIEDAILKIRNMMPLNVKKLERIMLILNDLPDVDVSAIIAAPVNPSAQKPGAVRLILQKNPSSDVLASIRFDNHGSVFTGPLQASGDVTLPLPGLTYSALNISGTVTAPLKEQKVGAVRYTVPVFGVSGTEITMTVSKSGTEPGSSLGPLNIKGESHSANIQISYPLIRRRDMTLRVDGGFEWKNARTKILGEEFYDDRMRILRTGLNLNFSDGWAGYNLFDLHASQGIEAFGVRKAGSENLSREKGRPDFRKAEFTAGRLQSFGRFEILGMMSGQYTNDALLSSEEFGFGGGRMGRGYDPSEITGDRGIALSFEVRMREQVQMYGRTFALQPYAFYDIGKVWNIDAGAKDNVSAASTGLGVRFDVAPGWGGDINLALPLTRSADNEPKYQDTVGSRILFSISKSF